MTEKIRSLRKNIDSKGQLIKSLAPSREVSLAYTSIQLCKMWLGRVLKELEAENPYPEGKNPYSHKIEPAADKAGFLFDDEFQMTDYDNFDHIQRVKWIRLELDKIEISLKELSSDFLGFAMVNSMSSCIESGLWLGCELGRIKEQEIKTAE
jgi:hypothetical protein